MNAIQQIAQRFGGLTAMARALGVPVTTVQYWCDTGFVPARRQQEVLRVGAALDPPLRATDLLGDAAAAESAPGVDDLSGRDG